MGGSCLSLVSIAGGFLRRSMVAAGFSSQAVDIDDDTTIHFWGPTSVSSSKPNLILIHGFGPASIWQWKQQMIFFSPYYNVYAPDLVFFGLSYTNCPERSEVFQAICMAKLLEKLGVHRYSVAGTSYGGFVAYRMAKMWPERVEKVVIASSGVNMVASDNVKLVKKAKVDKIEDLLLPTTGRQLSGMLGFVFYKPPYMPDFILDDFVDKMHSENRTEKMDLLKGLTIGQSETVDISPLSQQVLIAWGENDQIFLLEKAKQLQELLGEKAKLEVIKKAGHVPQIERPAQFNLILQEFLHHHS